MSIFDSNLEFEILLRNRMTKKEAAIVSAYTGFLVGDFSDLHKYVESLFGRPVFTHEMGQLEFAEDIRTKAKSDFLALSENLTE